MENEPEIKRNAVHSTTANFMDSAATMIGVTGVWTHKKCHCATGCQHRDCECYSSKNACSDCECNNCCNLNQASTNSKKQKTRNIDSGVLSAANSEVQGNDGVETIMNPNQREVGGMMKIYLTRFCHTFTPNSISPEDDAGADDGTDEESMEAARGKDFGTD